MGMATSSRGQDPSGQLRESRQFFTRSWELVGTNQRHSNRSAYGLLDARHHVNKKRKGDRLLFSEKPKVPGAIARRVVGIWFIRFQTHALLRGFSAGPPNTLMLTIKML